MHTERRAEKRHVIPKLWATVGRDAMRCEVGDIGRANARLEVVDGGFLPGEVHRVTIHIPVYPDRAVSVALKGTVTRIGDGDVAISYEPPSRTWEPIIEALARPRPALI